MEKVGYYQHPDGSAGNQFGLKNLAMDDKYIYASTNDSISEIHVLNYEMKLVFKTTNFGWGPVSGPPWRTFVAQSPLADTWAELKSSF